MQRIELDTLIGMAFSNLVALAIMLTAAATLHAANITNIETSAQAAEALRPIAGDYAGTIFALGIVGTGLLAVPVLAGSAAYAFGEAVGKPVGLARKPRKAKTFYGVIVAATLIGALINFSPDQPNRGALLVGGNQRGRRGSGDGDDDADGPAAGSHGPFHHLRNAANGSAGWRRC